MLHLSPSESKETDTRRVHLCRGFSSACKDRKETAARSSDFSFLFLSPSLLFQLSQQGASLDNRVPTPASAASADLPTQEVKTEAHHDQQEFEAAGGKTEPKMEVG